MTRALVTGGCGFVGTHLCKDLIQSGYEVVVLKRATTNTTSLKGVPVSFAQGDIADRTSLDQACKGIDVVFHLAALYREAKFPDSEYFRVNVEGTKNVFEAAIAAGVKKVIYCSTLGVHGGIKNPPADENTPYDPEDVYQISKTEAEKLVLTYIKPAHGAPRMPGAIIRPAMIWGPGDTRILKLFRGVARRALPIIGTGSQLVHWIQVQDLARAFRLAAEKDSALGEVILIAGDRPVTLRHTMERIAQEYKVSLLPFRIPAFPLYILGAVMEAIFVPLGIQPPLFRRRVTFFTKSRAYDRSKAKRVLGFEPSLRFEEEVAHICSWYRSKGWI